MSLRWSQPSKPTSVGQPGVCGLDSRSAVVPCIEEEVLPFAFFVIFVGPDRSVLKTMVTKRNCGTPNRPSIRSIRCLRNGAQAAVMRPISSTLYHHSSGIQSRRMFLRGSQAAEWTSFITPATAAIIPSAIRMMTSIRSITGLCSGQMKNMGIIAKTRSLAIPITSIL
jgi:hypothetical protein